MRLVPDTLSTTLDPSLLEPGMLAAQVNATSEFGVSEARAGIASLYKRSGFSNSDVLWGAGFGRYDDAVVVLLIIQSAGTGDARLHVYNMVTGASSVLADAHWTTLSASRWEFVQYGAYLYAINETDSEKGRFWRYRIAGTTAADWERVPIIYSDYDPSDATLAVERPSPVYTASTTWGNGDLAGTVAATPIADGSYYPTAGAFDDGRIKLSRSGTGSTPQHFVAWFMASFTSPLDLRKIGRYWYCEAEINWNDLEARPHEYPFFDLVNRPVMHAWVTNDAGASVSTAPSAGTWKQLRVKIVAIESLHPQNLGPTRIGIHLDFDSLQFGNTGTNWIGEIDKFAIGLPMRSGNEYDVYLSAPLRGGTFMNKPEYWAYMDGYNQDFITNPLQYYNSKLKDFEYATVSHTGSNESSATFARMGAFQGVGLAQYNALPPMGLGINIAVPAPSSGFTSVRVFRRRHSYSGQWWCIYEGAGSTTITDSRVDAAGDIVDWHDAAIWSSLPASPIIRASNYVWGAQTAAFTGQCLTSWKGHLVIGNGEEVFFSFQGDPTKYMRPERDRISYNEDTDDPTLGRTLYMSNTISDRVLGLVAADTLYGVGYEGVYALVGDSAVDSSEFRKIAQSKGAIGPEAIAPFEDGVLIGNMSGLYFVRLTRFGTAFEETEGDTIELTASNRPAWRMMMAKGAPNALVVAVLDDQIVASRGRFAMKRNKSGKWEYAEYNSSALTSGATTPTGDYGTPVAFPALPDPNPVEGITRRSAKSTYTGFSWSVPTPGVSLQAGWQWFWYDSVRGGLGVSRSGMLFQMDRGMDGVAYKTDAGYAIPWMATFGDLSSPGRDRRIAVKDVELIVDDQAPGSVNGPVRVILEEYDGKSGTRARVMDVPQTQEDFHSKAFSGLGGVLHTLTVASGNAAQRVIHTGLQFTETGKGKGG